MSTVDWVSHDSWASWFFLVLSWLEGPLGKWVTSPHWIGKHVQLWYALIFSCLILLTPQKFVTCLETDIRGCKWFLPLYYSPQFSSHFEYTIGLFCKIYWRVVSANQSELVFLRPPLKLPRNPLPFHSQPTSLIFFISPCKKKENRQQKNNGMTIGPGFLSLGKKIRRTMVKLWCQAIEINISGFKDVGPFGWGYVVNLIELS